MTDKITFQQNYIKTFISLLQFSAPAHGFYLAKQIKMQYGNPDRLTLIMQQQPKGKLSINA